MPRTRMDNLVDYDPQEELPLEEITKEKKKKKFDPSDGISCRSVTQGGLFMDGLKTQIPYRWTDYGDEVDVEYRDLVAAVKGKSPFVFNPYFIIDNEDFVEEFPQLKKFYTESYSAKDLKDILTLPIHEMLAKMKILPSGALDTLKNIASTQVATGKLDSVKKIKALDEFFGTDLNLLQSLFQ